MSGFGWEQKAGITEMLMNWGAQSREQRYHGCGDTARYLQVPAWSTSIAPDGDSKALGTDRADGREKGQCLKPRLLTGGGAVRPHTYRLWAGECGIVSVESCVSVCW